MAPAKKSDDEKDMGDRIRDAMRHTIPGLDPVMGAAERAQAAREARNRQADDEEKAPTASKSPRQTVGKAGKGVAKGDSARSPRAKPETTHGYTRGDDPDSSESVARRARLEARERSVAEREEALDRRQAELDRREAELNQRQAELNRRSGELDERQRSLDVASRRHYTVQSGDSLRRIAQQQYGDANRWQEIFNANRDQISDPDRIYAGQRLIIP